MVTFTTTGLVACVLVFLLVVSVGTVIILRKRQIDEAQEQAGRAGGVAADLGFKLFDDLCFAVGAGNLARIKSILKAWSKEYVQGEDGPKKLARDVIVACYPKIRDDEKYGNEVREAVVSSALGFSKDDQQKDIDFAKAAGRVGRLGWSKVETAGMGLAVKNYRQMTKAIVSLCDEVMEPNGEKEIALRVARPTIDACYNDASYRDKIMPILREYVAKDDARIAAEEAKAIEKAKELLAKENAVKTP